MTFRSSLTGLYRLICILCLAQIICSAWTMRTFGFTETGWGSGESQLMLMLGAAFTIPLVYRLAVHMRRTDQRFSRVDKHIEGLGMLLCFWILDFVAAGVFLFTRAGTTVLSPCFSDWFMTARCAPLAVGIALPLAVCATLLYMIVRIGWRARAMHGDAARAAALPRTEAH
ncbi:hypothetical protein FB451DRAFT_1264642 [Mycena latifolia]|nr:hypothetical protein FB451DRAFT_1264642 [Mycena latifolia]